jgi:hypothetical protein
VLKLSNIAVGAPPEEVVDAQIIREASEETMAYHERREVRLQLLKGRHHAGVGDQKGRRSNGDLVGGICPAPGLPVLLSVSSMNRSKSALIAFKCSSDALPCRPPHLLPLLGDPPSLISLPPAGMLLSMTLIRLLSIRNVLC